MHLCSGNIEWSFNYCLLLQTTNPAVTYLVLVVKSWLASNLIKSVNDFQFSLLHFFLPSHRVVTKNQFRRIEATLDSLYICCVLDIWTYRSGVKQPLGKQKSIMIPYFEVSMKMVPQAYQETAVNLSVWI